MPKLLYLVTEDWFFVSHFLPMARAARAAGFEVVVAARLRDHAARIEAEGCRVVPLEGERRSLGMFEALRGFARIDFDPWVPRGVVTHGYCCSDATHPRVR